MTRTKWSLLFALAFVSQIVSAQDRIHKIDSVLTDMYASRKFNGNILVAEKGQVIYRKSFGLSNETTKEKLNENSIFELASVSKQFTAMAIAILKEKGKLSFDDKISRFLPELAFYENVTIRQLLNHTGGLPDYMELMDRVYDKSRIATNKDIIELFAKYKPNALFAPNTKWQYSNTGYALLASIIEKAAGVTYGDYLQQTIFGPLNMTHTFVYSRRFAPKKVNNYAYGYIYVDSSKKYVLPDDLEQTRVVVWLDGIVGDGTVNSTVNDLLKWDRALYTTKLLSAEGMKALFEVGTLNDGSKTKYGMGWGIENTSDFGKIVSHSGGWPGYNTFIDRHIDNDKTIIILQNHEGVSTPVRSLRNILYNRPLEVKKARKEVVLTNEQLQKLSGVYEIQKGVELKVSSAGEQLYVQLTGQNAFPMYPESELFFFLKVVDAQIQFVKDDSGKISHLTLFQNGNKTDAKRIGD